MASKLYGVNATIIIFVFVLYCIVLYCIYCILLYCIVLYCIVLYCILLYCIVLYCIVLYWIQVNFFRKYHIELKLDLIDVTSVNKTMKLKILMMMHESCANEARSMEQAGG